MKTEVVLVSVSSDLILIQAHLNNLIMALSLESKEWIVTI